MKNSFKIADISFGNSEFGEHYEFEYDQSFFEVHRFGTDRNVDHAKELVKSLRSSVDAITFSSFPESIRYHNRTFVHREYMDLFNFPTNIPKFDGRTCREILIIDGLNRALEKKNLDPSKGVFFPTGLIYLEVIKELRKNYNDHLWLGDGVFLSGAPIINRPTDFSPLTYGVLHAANLRPLKDNAPKRVKRLNPLTKKALFSALDQCEYIFSNLGVLSLFEDVEAMVKGKTIICPIIHPGIYPEAKRWKAKEIIELFPKKLKFTPYIGYPVLEAALRLNHKKTSGLELKDWDELLGESLKLSDSTKSHLALSKPSMQMGITSRVTRMKKKFLKQDRPIDFAFVVHALSHRDLARVPGLGFMKNASKQTNIRIENLISKAPGVTYGRIENIISESTGREVNGIIYGLFSTPKAMKNSKPEVVYRKIERLCHMAAGEGARIIGLGAYTKVVGDSGFTINRNSPIPVTTGNSLSASATLWSARDALAKLGFVGVDPQTSIVDGVAMVIGATGSIGRVSAKLLAAIFRKLVIVAPRREKLELLKLELTKEFPTCEVLVATRADELVGECDLLVTATSAVGQKIVDIMKVKPGAVVCDCSRPLDFSPSEARLRPDILIIESGELVLPGPYNMSCDLGLPGKTVYACLAETALLALEERYESFTLGREIEWQKVKEIYQLSLKHGVRLADIQSHTGSVTDREIQLIQKIACEKGAQIWKSKS